MQPVKIHIYSQSHSSAGMENIETTAYGRLAEKNNKYYVFYDEGKVDELAKKYGIEDMICLGDK